MRSFRVPQAGFHVERGIQHHGMTIDLPVGRCRSGFQEKRQNIRTERIAWALFEDEIEKYIDEERIAIAWPRHLVLEHLVQKMDADERCVGIDN